MARQKVEVRREEILAATVAAIEKHGMSTVRVADVAATLGVSTGLVFYHFDTKDALLVASLEFAVERDLQRLRENLARGDTPAERLSRVIASYGPTGAAEGWTLWIDAWATGLREPMVAASLRRLDTRWRDALRDTIHDGVERGDFTCDDPAAAVQRVGSLLDGLSVAAVVYGSVTRDQLTGWVREAAAHELGISPEALGRPEQH